MTDDKPRTAEKPTAPPPDTAEKAAEPPPRWQQKRQFVRRLPGWIYRSDEYRQLSALERRTLGEMASRCDPPDQAGSLFICFGGDDLIDEIGIRPRTFWRHVEKLEKLGFVVCVSRGGGRPANAYALPGSKGLLDHLAVERRATKSGQGGADPRWWVSRASVESGTAPVSPGHTTRDSVAQDPCHSGTVPDHVPAHIPDHVPDGLVGEKDIFAALTDCGIEEPTRTRLVEKTPGLTAAIVLAVWAKVKTDPTVRDPRRVLVHQLQTRGRKLVTEQRRAAKKQWAAGEQQRQQIQQDRTEVDRVLAELSPEQLDEVWRPVAGIYVGGKPLSELVEAPRTDELARWFMWRHVQQYGAPGPPPEPKPGDPKPLAGPMRKALEMAQKDTLP